MILDEKNREKLINLVKKDLKENPCNKNTEALLKELDSMKSEKIYEKILELEKLKKIFYESTKNNIDDYETYKSQLDAFCINVGELFLEMSNEI